MLPRNNPTIVAKCFPSFAHTGAGSEACKVANFTFFCKPTQYQMVNATGTSLTPPPSNPPLCTVDLVALAKKGDLAGLEKGVAALRTVIATLDKKDNGPTQTALAALSTLATSNMLEAQPFLLDCLTAILDATGEKKASSETKVMAADCAKTICSKMSANALALILPTLHKAVHFESRWQTRVAALDIIAEFSNNAPEQLGHALPEVIPEISQCIVDLKAEVCVSNYISHMHLGRRSRCKGHDLCM